MCDPGGEESVVYRSSRAISSLDDELSAGRRKDKRKKLKTCEQLKS